MNRLSLYKNIICLFSIIILQGNSPYYKSPTPDQNLSCKEFPKLLKKIIGDGDLRNISRFSHVIDSSVTVVPRFLSYTEPPNLEIIDGFHVVFDSSFYLLKDSIFNFNFSVGSNEYSERFSQDAPVIAMMYFNIPEFLECITKQDIVSEFGNPEDDQSPANPGFTTFKIIAGKKSYYTTKIIGTSLSEKKYISILEVIQYNSLYKK